MDVRVTYLKPDEIVHTLQTIEVEEKKMILRLAKENERQAAVIIEIHHEFPGARWIHPDVVEPDDSLEPTTIESEEQAQLDFLTPQDPHTKARSDDPGTSKRAAWDNLPRAGSQRHRILKAIMESPNGIVYDQAVELGIPGVSASGRLTELARGGWIELDGERSTSNGSDARVWVATEKANRHRDVIFA